MTVTQSSGRNLAAQPRFRTSTLKDVLGAAIPSDHARQVDLDRLVRAELAASSRPLKILDLGAGDGRAIDLFADYPHATYHGVDVDDSPEAKHLRRTDHVVTFDGVHLPFANAMFDLVYSRQVLEHVRHPEPLLAEVTRVLKPGGRLMASCSFLEPYHSYSIFHLSPYGVRVLIGDAGLRLDWIRPGVDGATMILRNVSNAKGLFNRWMTRESPLNRAISFARAAQRRSIVSENAAKLGVAGHLVFQATKPTAPGEGG